MDEVLAFNKQFYFLNERISDIKTSFMSYVLCLHLMLFYATVTEIVSISHFQSQQTMFLFLVSFLLLFFFNFMVMCGGLLVVDDGNDVQCIHPPLSPTPAISDAWVR